MIRKDYMITILKQYKSKKAEKALTNETFNELSRNEIYSDDDYCVFVEEGVDYSYITVFEKVEHLSIWKCYDAFYVTSPNLKKIVEQINSTYLCI